MKILDLPEQNRPRERFKSNGPEAPSDAELFERFGKGVSPYNYVKAM
ncbi:MAG: hypothetical protein KKB31_05235 [Nanoarchaeota archaeon]|nr:hypothetical protein [Nanoarchaeota archaeon]